MLARFYATTCSVFIDHIPLLGRSTTRSSLKKEEEEEEEEEKWKVRVITCCWALSTDRKRASRSSLMCEVRTPKIVRVTPITTQPPKFTHKNQVTV